MPEDYIGIEAFYKSLDEGILLGVRCRNGHVMIPTKPICIRCNSRELKPIKLTGKGKLLSFTEIFTPAREYEKYAPYFLGLIELDEGCRLMGRIIVPRDSIQRGINLTVGSEPSKKEGWPTWPKIVFTP